MSADVDAAKGSVSGTCSDPPDTHTHTQAAVSAYIKTCIFTIHSIYTTLSTAKIHINIVSAGKKFEHKGAESH